MSYLEQRKALYQAMQAEMWEAMESGECMQSDLDKIEAKYREKIDALDAD